MEAFVEVVPAQPSRQESDKDAYSRADPAEIVPDLPFCAPNCCVDACVVRTNFVLLSQQMKNGADGVELAALAHTDLERNFYCWRDSNARYVCSVFPIEQANVVSEFSDVAILGVERRGEVVRPVCRLHECHMDGTQWRVLCERAASAGATELHVYFSDDPQKILAFAALFPF
jgi:hypothetical protein